jgi:hypothetical protein
MGVNLNRRPHDCRGVGPPDENRLTADDDRRVGLEVFAERPDSAIEIRYRADNSAFRHMRLRVASSPT